MDKKTLEQIFDDTLILQHAPYEHITVENGLSVFTPFTDIQEHLAYVCTYEVFFASVLPVISGHSCRPCFFVLDTSCTCRLLSPVLLQDFKGSLFFLRLSWDTFMTRYMTLLTQLDRQIPFHKYETYQNIWKSLLSGNTQDFSVFSCALKKFVACIVLEKEDNSEISNSTLPSLIQALVVLFPETNMFPYEGRFILLHSQEYRPGSYMDFSYEEFNRILEQFQLTAGISNACRHTDMYGTLYLTVLGALRLAKQLPMKRRFNRIIQYEQYSTYYIIDLCVQEFIRIHQHRDIIYLISPAVIELYRYDKAHNTDLLKTLFSYLLSGRNVSETASVLYMHRNTVFNKLNKIHSIIGLPLEDGNMQFKLLMSCFVVTYYQDYLKENL